MTSDGDQQVRPAKIRFAVGSPDGPRSGVWVLWTMPHKNDVYLAARSLGGVFKVSLHADREGQPASWRIAFNDPNSPFLRPGQDRVVERWVPPTELAPGWTRAFEITVLASELTVPQDGDHDPGNVAWISPPALGFGVDFDVFLSAPGVTGAEGWPGRDSLGTRRLFCAPLANGQHAWLLASYGAVSQEVRDGIDRFHRLIEQSPVRVLDDVDWTSLRQPRAFLGGILNDGTRYFLDLALDPAQHDRAA
jgi:hypothetical protein